VWCLQQQQEQQQVQQQEQQRQQQQQAEQAQQMSRAHIQSLQHQRVGVLAASSAFDALASAYADQPQRLEPPFVGGSLPINTTATGSQASGFGTYTTQQRAEDQLTAAAGGGGASLSYGGGTPHQGGGAPSEAATSFPGFGGVGAASSTASPSMSAWPADQKLVMAMTVGGASGVVASSAQGAEFRTGTAAIVPSPSAAV